MEIISNLNNICKTQGKLCLMVKVFFFLNIEMPFTEEEKALFDSNFDFSTQTVIRK